MGQFEEVFKALIGEPFQFQREFAEATELPKLVHVPTGLGKTAMVIVGWLWRRHGASDKIKNVTPRRLVYCLPMRVLVEQTRDNAKGWICRLQDKKLLPEKVPVHILMGGEDETDWDLRPEREAIIIGTQDMLLSRALNRGYAASRSRWPMQFGLLHTDCLWVFDEIQLMGPGLATTAQLEAFRCTLGARDGHGCQSVWMSATMQKDWLKTVDFDPASLGEPLSPDYAKETEEVRKRWNAGKPVQVVTANIGDATDLVVEIRREHKAGTRTIVVVNTVKRARELFDALTTAGNGSKGKGEKKRSSQDSGATTASAPKPRIVLLHSRFRPCDRKKRMEEALANIQPNDPGVIVVSTQVIEAGVDVSATTLFTELAPWASLVQRFGRCNRRGTEDGHAHVFYIDLPDKNPDRVAAPYELDNLKEALALLKKCKSGVGPKALNEVARNNTDEFSKVMRFEHTHVIRRKDMVDLFDTTPDLAGNDIDIDRFIRDVEETDVRVFWRAWSQPKGHEAPPEDEPSPRRDELCPAPVGEFREFAKKRSGKVWRWNFLDRKWEKADRIAPGHVFLVHSDAGGYRSDKGWDAASKEPVPAPKGEPQAGAADSTDDDASSHIGVWQTIAKHSDAVCKELSAILANLPHVGNQAASLLQAARWHDRGKAHDVFVKALPGAPPDALVRGDQWAKAAGQWRRYERKHFRHELASALAVLDPANKMVPDDLRDLVAYLVAAHHGKVRLSIRSLPNEKHPDPRQDNRGRQRRFARGVWDADVLPQADLGGGVIAPAVALSLEPMELGLCEEEPFIDQPSWAERMLRLRERLGPFRLAYLEAILRAADMRASKEAGHD